MFRSKYESSERFDGRRVSSKDAEKWINELEWSGEVKWQVCIISKENGGWWNKNLWWTSTIKLKWGRETVYQAKTRAAAKEKGDDGTEVIQLDPLCNIRSLTEALRGDKRDFVEGNR